MTTLRVIDKDGTIVAETNAAPIFSLDVDRMMIVSPPQGFTMVTSAPGKAPFTARLGSIVWKLNNLEGAHLQRGTVMTFALLECSIYGIEEEG